MPIRGVKVIKQKIHEDLYWGNTKILHYTIEYPQFQSEEFKFAVTRMNEYYRGKALELQKYAKQTVLRNAVSHFQYSVSNSYPVMEYEVVQIFQTTYNQNCTYSMYTDCYIYEGGAHGMTTRESQTWDLQTGLQIPLSEIFKKGTDYKKYLIAYITDQIDNQVKNSKDILYFEPHEENVSKNFRPDNFYLVKLGLVIYFQLYELAPYVAGITEFTIPAGDYVIMPDCE